MKDVYYHRNLPHYHIEGYPLFITFRLFGSLPMEVLTQLKAQRESELKALKNQALAKRHEVEKKHFERYDDWLDRCEFGPRAIAISNCSALVVSGSMRVMIMLFATSRSSSGLSNTS